jgi:hypothetical protein
MIALGGGAARCRRRLLKWPQMRKKKPLFLLTGALALALTSCSETPTPTAKKEAEKPPEPVTGLSALFKMYQVARSMGPDVRILKMNSMLLSEVPNVPRGKAAAWQATFVSAEKSQAKSFTYSIIELAGQNLHKGVFAGPDEGWTGTRGTPIAIADVKIDTDAAYETALKQAGDYNKKNPDKPITIVLEKVPKHSNPVWRIVWGESVGTSNFSIYVDAFTGEFKEKLH